jgi:hypothetical protein
MLKKLMIMTIGLTLFSVGNSVMAANPQFCNVRVAISSPPLSQNDNVAFNVNNDAGIVKSALLNQGHTIEVIDGLLCSNDKPYTVSATAFANKGLRAGPIGQCKLKAGPIYLSSPQSNITVVFPQDFDCQS